MSIYMHACNCMGSSYILLSLIKTPSRKIMVLFRLKTDKEGCLQVNIRGVKTIAEAITLGEYKCQYECIRKQTTTCVDECNVHDKHI